MNLARYRKALVAAVVAGGSAAASALQDGHITAFEATTIVLAVLGGLGFTWAVPNKQPSTASPEA
ncbi:hypothetical protein ACWCPD_16385 [Streptomyces sp. NPDC001935]